MQILNEGALDKAMDGPENFRQEKIWKKIYEVIDEKYFKQSDIEFPKEFLLKCKQYFNVSHFIPFCINIFSTNWF